MRRSCSVSLLNASSRQVTMADCRYFEEDFTTLPARLSEISAEDLQAIQQERFDGFDYTNPNNTD